MDINLNNYNRYGLKIISTNINEEKG